MRARTKTTPPLKKPGDLVRTPAGRSAHVVEIQPSGMRLIEHIDGARERVAMHMDDLFLVREAKPVAWTKHAPPAERFIGRGRIQRLA